MPRGNRAINGSGIRPRRSSGLTQIPPTPLQYRPACSRHPNAYPQPRPALVMVHSRHVPCSSDLIVPRRHIQIAALRQPPFSSLARASLLEDSVRGQCPLHQLQQVCRHATRSARYSNIVDGSCFVHEGREIWVCRLCSTTRWLARGTDHLSRLQREHRQSYRTGRLHRCLGTGERGAATTRSGSSATGAENQGMVMSDKRSIRLPSAKFAQVREPG